MIADSLNTDTYFVFCLGKFEIYCRIRQGYNGKYKDPPAEDNTGFYKKIVHQMDTQQKKRKKMNKCRHCGGSFKGIFSKVCSKCGNPKDY